MSNMNTKHYDIFSYWKDKRITKDGSVVEIKDYLANNPKGYDVIEDWGEPECFCCRKFIRVDRYASYLDWLDDCDFKSIWNNAYIRSRLQRCHIIPQSMGGTDDPSNLFLMCNKCHKEAPDTTDYKGFIRYIYKKRARPDYIDVSMRIYKECNELGLSANSGSFDDMFSKLTTHFNYIPNSTFVTAYVSTCAPATEEELQEQSERLREMEAKYGW